MIAYSISGQVTYDGYRPEVMDVAEDGTLTGKLGRKEVRLKVKPLHVELANLPITPHDCAEFTKTYGPLMGVEVTGWSRIADGKITPPSEIFLDRGRGDAFDDAFIDLTFRVTLLEIAEAQQKLQLAWRGDYNARKSLQQVVRETNFRAAPPTAQVRFATRDLWGFICYLFLLQHSEGVTNTCQREGCTTPYFVQQRSDRLYCSHACAVTATNLRRAKEGRNHEHI